MASKPTNEDVAELSQDDRTDTMRDIVTKSHEPLAEAQEDDICCGPDDEPSPIDPNSPQASMSADNDVEDIVGFSIGQAQDYLKSPETPALEKAKVLEASNEYFATIGLHNDDGAPVEDDSQCATPVAGSPSSRTLRKNRSPEGPRNSSQSPWNSHDRQKRSVVSRSLLGQSLHGLRKRASSGPIALGKSLKKMLPDRQTFFPTNVPAVAGFGYGAQVAEPEEMPGDDCARGRSPSLPRSLSINTKSSLINRRQFSRTRASSLSPLNPNQDSRPRAQSLSPMNPGQHPGSRAQSLSPINPTQIRPALGRQRSTPALQITILSTSEQSNKFIKSALSPLLSPALLSPALLSPALTVTRTSKQLRRSISETSLFLKRTSTAASSAAAYDDPARFADVSEQVNSRFKAITDSLQDSAFRMPKISNVNFSAMIPSFDWPGYPSESKSPNAGRSTTDLTSGSTQAQPKHETETPVSNPTHRSHPIISSALEKMTGDVVVLGGYRGSILRSAEAPHRQLWVPVKVGLNIRKVDLEVGLADEDEELMHEKIFASGILSHIGPIDIARRLLRHLRKCPNAKGQSLRVHDYGYDWRLSPDLLSRRLIQYLEKLECNQPNTPKEKRGAYVVAHSLGGLITRHAVNQRPDLFAGVVYAGVPQTCVNILGPLRNGDEVLLSSRVLTAQINFTFRTSFALLPEDGRCFLDKRTGERYDVDFFNPESYDEYRLSPCINPPIPALPRHGRKSLADALSSTLPTRRPSWFSSRSGSPAPDAQSPRGEVKDAVKERAKSTADGLCRAEDKVLHPEAHAGNIEPTMSPSSTKSLFGSHSNPISTQVTIPRQDAQEYLTRTLASVLAFKKALAFNPLHQESNAYPPLAFIFGKSVPTVYGARVASREAIKYSDAFDDLAFAAGDGVVLASSAQLPKGYRCVRGGKVETDRGHVGLLGDLEGVGKALAALVEAREKGVGLGKSFIRGRR